MICAGETSGELYGALLSRELKKSWPEIQIFGIGGNRMESEGVTLIAPITHSLGIIEVINHLGEIRRTFKKAEKFLTDQKPDVLVLIDYPDFNIRLARKAKAAGIPMLYYVSPQVWAWRGGRVNKIAALVNKMAVLFPFEVAYYERSGLPCEFVGHPITESIHLQDSEEDLKIKLGLDPEKKVISLLPGSRPNELIRHQFLIMELAAKINRAYPDMHIVMPLAPGTEFPATLPDYIKTVHGQTTEALACSAVAAVASGTATLETALIGTPMVVYYKISPVTFYLARLLTNVKFISLVNVLSGREVVKELLQKEASAAMIFSEIDKILKDSVYRNNMLVDLKIISQLMENKKPSARVASIVGKIAGWSST
jgi:lipid-A-disaccharide synthase